jgi:diguanylate cyclase (GGDEF)-like protein
VGPVRRFAITRLRYRLLLLVLLVVLPALALILSTAWEQRRQAADDAKADALRLARVASSQHERLIEGARSLLIGLAQLSDVQMHNSRACSALFAEVQRRFPLYQNIGAVRPDGQVFCTARGRPGSRNVGGIPHFQQALSAREFTVSGYRTDRPSGRPILTVAYPAIDRSGAVWAVVFADLDLGWLRQLGEKAALPPESTVGIVDATGHVLARYPDSGERLLNPPVDLALARPAARREREGMVEGTSRDGIPRLYAFTTLAGLPPAEPLYVTVGIPRRAALAGADRLLARNLLWAAVVILLTLAAGAVATDLFILRRIGAVVRAARRLSAGDLSARSEVRGADEISLLARSFNAMAERLEERVRDEQEAKEQLAERVTELDLLNRMGELLQSCFTLEEAYAVIGSLAPRLFPGEAGAILSLDRTRGALDAVATWGVHPLDGASFPGEDCWAMRHGRTHVVGASASTGRCGHLPDPPPTAYLCTPLLAQGNALGVLYVTSEAGARGLTEARLRLAEAVAAQLGLGLANVQLRETLRLQSIHDALTGLFNRRYMEETLEREVHRARRLGRPMSLLMLDVDSFKQQNDCFGHEGGDAVLRALGALLKANLRKEDIACRYGGEEFVLVLPDASLEAATRRAEQLRAAVKDLRIPFGDRVIGPITVSVGAAAFPEHGADGHALLQSADAALYRAKNEGRDRVSVATLLHPTV